MAGPIYLSTLADTLKRTLDDVMTDDPQGENLVLNKYCQMRPMTDAYHTDLDVSGPALASLKGEGQAIQLESIQQGVKWKYFSQTYALKLIISEELEEDGKYSKAIDMAMFNRDSIWSTCEYLAVSMLINRDDANYLGGDGVALASTAHPITSGGTYQNVLTTPAAPSTNGLGQVIADLVQLPGRNGLIKPVRATGVLFPAIQWQAWTAVLKSPMDPRAGNFTEINTLKNNSDMVGSLEPIMIPYWQGADNDWAVKTDVKRGLTWRWRRKPRARTWKDNNTETTHHSQSFRAGFGWSDPRGIYFGGTTS